jgi:hypothetical protein
MEKTGICEKTCRKYRSSWENGDYDKVFVGKKRKSKAVLEEFNSKIISFFTENPPLTLLTARTETFAITGGITLSIWAVGGFWGQTASNAADSASFRRRRTQPSKRSSSGAPWIPCSKRPRRAP